jgi:hypothetical protein
MGLQLILQLLPGSPPATAATAVPTATEIPATAAMTALLLLINAPIDELSYADQHAADRAQPAPTPAVTSR